MYVCILNHCDDIIGSVMCLPTSHCVWDNNTTGNWHGASVSPHVTSGWPAFVYLMLSESAHHLDSPPGPKYRKRAALAVSASLVGWVWVPWWAGRPVICVVVPSSWSWHSLPPRCATQRRCSAFSPPDTSLSLGFALEIERHWAHMLCSPKGQQVVARGSE